MNPLLVGDCDSNELCVVLARFGLQTLFIDDAMDIPGSYWGDSEAGLAGDRIFLRRDTPLHSALHEACHYVCMDSTRRQALHRDAGGDFTEENAVCYLQILLADHVPGFGRRRAMRDMDAWGYTFRLGSARAWFEDDAADAKEWLMRAELIDGEQRITWRLRTA